VRKLKSDTKGPILCFRRTARDRAKTLARPLDSARRIGTQSSCGYRLGGIRDEAEDSRPSPHPTSGSLPGRMIQGLRNAGSNNPLFILDEVDKLGMDFSRRPRPSALLEVLDPEHRTTPSSIIILDVPFRSFQSVVP